MVTDVTDTAHALVTAYFAEVRWRANPDYAGLQDELLTSRVTAVHAIDALVTVLDATLAGLARRHWQNAGEYWAGIATNNAATAELEGVA